MHHSHSFSPFNSPSIPSAPHPTPSSTLKSGSRVFHPKFPRAPTQNPYDKFSQGDFDAWIGRLTGDLERALGYREIDQLQSQASALGSDSRTAGEEDYLETDSYVEDSFAEVKARRTNKGKARDPREGPGLGPKYGDQEQPIEIPSEEEVENQEEPPILDSWGSEEEGEEKEGEDDEEGESEYDEEREGEYNEEGQCEYDEEAESVESVEREENGESVSLTRVREEWNQNMHGVSSGAIKTNAELAGFVDYEEDYEEQEYEEDYNEEEDEGAQVSKQRSAERVITLLSDDEPSPRIDNQQQDEEEFLSDDQATDLRSSPAQVDGDAGVSEDGYKIQVEQDDDSQPSDEDTSFPPHASTKGEPVNPLVDIRDPWAQVSKYAEDYYAGGQVPRLAKGFLSAHHLSVDDDGSGFLSPEVVNNAELASDEDEEQVDETEEVEDDMMGDDTRAIESERFDKHEHLFNRLRSSHFPHPPGISYSRGLPRHMGLSVKSASGTNEEPIMIESDDEEEELAQFFAIRRHERYDDTEGENEQANNSDDRDHHLEDQEDEGGSLKVNQGTEGRTPGSQEEVIEEPRETCVILNKIHVGAEVNDTPSGEAVQPATSFLDDQSPQVVQQPTEPPLLPTPPLESFEPVKATIGADVLAQSVTGLYDGITATVSNEPRDIHQETKTVPECTNDIPRYNLDISAAFSPSDAHDLADPLETSFNHLDVRRSIAGLLHGLDTVNANIDVQAFEFDDMMTSNALDTAGQQHTVHMPMETGMSRSGEEGSLANPDEKINGDTEINEVNDERPEAIPFMTSDLDSSEPEEVDAGGEVIQILHSIPFEAGIATQRVPPLEVVKASEEAECDNASEVQIQIVESEDHWPGTPPEDITIEIRAATPIPPPSTPPVKDRFEKSSETQPRNRYGTAAFEEEQVPVSALSASFFARKIVTREALTVEESAVIDDERKGEAFVGATQEAEGADPIESMVHVEEAGLTITIEEDDSGVYPREGVPSAYTVEEAFSESEYLLSEAPSRAASLSVVNMQVDEVIPSTVMIGDVDDSISGVEIEIESAKDADVRNAQWTVQLSLKAETHPEEILAEAVPTQAHTVTGPTPESSEADNYFDQPGTPAMFYTGTGDDIIGHASLTASPSGRLPTIIQLPGTPQKVLSPGGTLGLRPTPVAIAVDPAVLKALKKNPALFSPPPTLPLPRHPHEGTPSYASGTRAPTASATVEATFTREAATKVPPPSLSKTQSPREPEIVETSIANGDVVQTSIPAIATSVKPTLPILFDDPYPYSLSTPGPRNEGVEEEEFTEQDNSISSSSSAEKSTSSATGEPISSTVASVELQHPPTEKTKPPESVANPQVDVDAVVNKVLEVKKGLMDAEAEASRLIDEFVVDEPESDTDADGEADPEFVGLKTNVRDTNSNKVAVQKVGELTPRIAVDAITGEIEPLPAQEERDERKAFDENNAAMATLQEDQDPFRLMGNDSTVTPGEAPDLTSAQQMWAIEQAEDSESEAEVAAATMPRLQPLPTNEPSHETSATSRTDAFLSPPQPQSIPTPASQMSLAPEITQPPGSDANGDYDTSRLDFPTPPPHSQHQTAHARPRFPATSHPNTTVSPRVVPQASPENKCIESPLSTAEVKTKELPHKVHISVEDPYHADHDSDHDEGTGASGAKKRKRGHSDASTTELPATPTNLASVGRGKSKGGSTSTRSTGRATRFSKNGSQKRDPYQIQFKRRKFPSKTTSRSPSVASTVASTIPSESSLFTSSSPTHPSPASSEPRPFLHAHSRRKRGKVPTTVQEQQLQKQRATSSGSRAGILRAEDVLTKAPSTSSANPSSPVTRSHCRYHKISIPKTENGPRVNFLVPGCSLNDEDLINEEEIEDHGEAVIQGDTRIVDDIETLDFEAYLHWVMRQLVGLEILRENEVFYLPEPGEEIVRNSHRPEKRKGGKPEKKRSKLTDEATADSQRNSNAPSQGSSVGSSVSVLRKLLGSGAEDLSTVTETEDHGSPAPLAENKVVPLETRVGTLANGPSRKSDNDSVLSRKRGRRLGQDATAYHPSTDTDESSSIDLSDYNPGRKTLRSRGQKRPRAIEPSATDGVDGKKSKKPKTRPNPNEVPSENQLLTPLDQGFDALVD